MPQLELNFKPYKRKLRTPLKTARGTLFERIGLILELKELNAGTTPYYSEAVILEHFGSESYRDAVDFLTKCTKEVRLETFSLAEHSEANREKYPASTFSLEAALLQLNKPELFSTFSRKTLPLSKLLPNGDKALEGIKSGLSSQYKTFKWKLGIDDFKKEIDILSRIFSIIPSGVKIRIDANEGLTKDQACFLLEFLENQESVEFLEQPFKRDKIEELILLQEQFSTQIALDESIATTSDIISAEKAGWKGVFAVKPLRLFELEKFLNWREHSQAKISYSTVLESPFGENLGLWLAASDKNNKLAAGYGVKSWYEKDKFSEEELKESSELKAPFYKNSVLRQIWEKI